MLKRNVRVGVAGLLVLLSFPLGASAQNVVVLESTAAIYQAGQQIASGRNVQLGTGEKLIVITEKGSSFELIGPLNSALSAALGGPVSGVQGSTQATTQGAPQTMRQVKTLIQRLTAQKAVDNTALGVIRQSAPIPDSFASAVSVIGFSNLFRDVPVGLNGRFCVQKSGKALRFKGAEPTQTLRLRAVSTNTGVMGEGSTSYRTLIRSQALSIWAWPADMSTLRSGKFLLRDGEASIPYVIELVPVQFPPDMVDDKASNQKLEYLPYVAAVLASKGCAWQAQVLTQSEQF